MMKRGYRVEITSWENDADYYRTKVVEGLPNIESARFISECMDMFQSCNNRASSGEAFGSNSGASAFEVNSALLCKFHKYEEFLPQFIKDYFINEETGNHYWFDTDPEDWYVTDFLYDTLGFTEEISEYGYYRTLDSLECYYIPVDIPEVQL